MCPAGLTLGIRNFPRFFAATGDHPGRVTYRSGDLHLLVVLG